MKPGMIDKGECVITVDVDRCAMVVTIHIGDEVEVSSSDPGVIASIACDLANAAHALEDAILCEHDWPIQ